MSFVIGLTRYYGIYNDDESRDGTGSTRVGHSY